MNENTDDNQNDAENDKTDAQNKRQSLKEIAGKTDGQDRFTHVCDRFGDEFPCFIMERYHGINVIYNPSIVNPKFCQGDVHSIV